MTAACEIKISLCIPTYNRAALLEQALCAIATQGEHDLSVTQRSTVEIIISDNHSTDDTAAIIETALSGTDMCVRYFCQPENRGADANILNAMQNAQGTFVYLLSDDDVLLPGALAKLLDLIANYPDADGFCLNAKPFVTDVDEENGQNFRLAADQRFEGRDVCLNFLSTWITFISALAFRRDRIAGRDYTAYAGTSLLQSYVYLDVLSGTPTIVATQQPFLAVRGYNSGGFNFFEVFVTQFHTLMFHAQALGFASQTVRRVLGRHLRVYLTPYAIVLRVSDSYGTFQPDFRDARRRLWKAYGPQPFLLWVTLPALSVPCGLLRALHRGLKQAKRFSRRLRPGRALPKSRIA